MRRSSRSAAAAVALAALGPALAAKGELKIAAGPNLITEEEKAIAPDPNQGMEHGVVLLEEWELDETLGTDRQVSYHLRAKVLSGEGRALGDVEVPLNVKTGELKQWWARVFHPDGTYHVLKREDLKPRMRLRGTRETGAEVLKGVIPGIEPGCVVDYGYVYRDAGIYRMTRMPLQSRWPVKERRLRWKSYPFLLRSHRLTRTEGLDVKLEKTADGVQLVARNLPPVVDEPYMPSPDAVQAMAAFYYLEKETDTKDFWNSEARRVERRAAEFGIPRAVRDAIAAMKIPDGAGLEEKLRIAYAWIAANVRNTSFQTVEEEEEKKAEREEEDDPAKPPRSAADVLAAKEGTGRQIVNLFLVVARALGAEADLVWATDRTDHYWDNAVLSTAQFDRVLVAVRAPGDPDDKAVIVAPDSGLPYGEIPWWVTGTAGWLATSKGGRQIGLYGSNIEKNLSERKAEIRFEEDGAVRVRWSETATGQQGYGSWTRLKRTTPEDRGRVLDDLCGAGGAFEVTRAEGPAVEAPILDYRIACEGELSIPGPGEDIPTYSFGIAGPWIRPVPELTAATRAHPAVFAFPRIDRATLDVAAPAGFAPGRPPAPVHLEERFARFTLRAVPTPSGFRVEREFAFAPLIIMPDEYPDLREFLAGVRKADLGSLEFARKGVGP
jgi:hypothetical protein